MAYEADRRVIESHQRLVRRVAVRVRAYCTQEWRGLGSWRDEDISRFIARIVPVVTQGELHVGNLTNAYLDSMARLAGMAPLPTAAPVIGPALRSGMATEDVLRRPAVTVYTALKEGKTLGEAVRLGEIRLDDIIVTNMQLAQTHTAQARMGGATNVVGYRRVLTGAENCALCALAASQRYRKENLMPIHPGCDCSVAPIYGDHDPGQVINDELYDKTMAALESAGVGDTHAGTGKARDVTNLMIREHGELGPTLTWRDQHFTKL